MTSITLITKFAFESMDTSAFPIAAVAMSITIRHFTLIMSQAALFTLPPWVAVAFTIDVLTTLTAQNWTNTYRKKIDKVRLLKTNCGINRPNKTYFHCNLRPQSLACTDSVLQRTLLYPSNRSDSL